MKTCLFFLIFAIAGTGFGEEKRLTDEQREAVITQTVKHWQSLYGKVDFHNMWLFRQMVYIKPEKESRYRTVKWQKLPEQEVQVREAFSEEMFRGELENQLRKPPKPKVSYAQNTSQTDHFKFMLKIGEQDVQVREASAAYLLELPVELSKAQVLTFLKDNVELKEESMVALKEQMDAELSEGQVYTTGKEKVPEQIRGWDELVTIFVGNSSVNVILFKAQPGRAMMGLPAKDKWLSPSKEDAALK